MSNSVQLATLSLRPESVIMGIGEYHVEVEKVLHSHVHVHAEIYIYILDTYQRNDKDAGRTSLQIYTSHFI